MAKSKIITGSGNVRTGQGQVFGFIVNSHTSGTLALYDSVGGGQDMIMNTFTFATGSGVYRFPEPIEYFNGLYATTGGSALSISIITS